MYNTVIFLVSLLYANKDIHKDLQDQTLKWLSLLLSNLELNSSRNHKYRFWHLQSIRAIPAGRTLLHLTQFNKFSSDAVKDLPKSNIYFNMILTL